MIALVRGSTPTSLMKMASASGTATRETAMVTVAVSPEKVGFPEKAGGWAIGMGSIATRVTASAGGYNRNFE